MGIYAEHEGRLYTVWQKPNSVHILSAIGGDVEGDDVGTARRRVQDATAGLVQIGEEVTRSEGILLGNLVRVAHFVADGERHTRFGTRFSERSFASLLFHPANKRCHGYKLDYVDHAETEYLLAEPVPENVVVQNLTLLLDCALLLSNARMKVVFEGDRRLPAEQAPRLQYTSARELLQRHPNLVGREHLLTEIEATCAQIDALGQKPNPRQFYTAMNDHLQHLRTLLHRSPVPDLVPDVTRFADELASKMEMSDEERTWLMDRTMDLRLDQVRQHDTLMLGPSQLEQARPCCYFAYQPERWVSQFLKTLRDELHHATGLRAVLSEEDPHSAGFPCIGLVFVFCTPTLHQEDALLARIRGRHPQDVLLILLAGTPRSAIPPGLLSSRPTLDPRGGTYLDFVQQLLQTVKTYV